LSGAKKKILKGGKGKKKKEKKRKKKPWGRLKPKNQVAGEGGGHLFNIRKFMGEGGRGVRDVGRKSAHFTFVE